MLFTLAFRHLWVRKRRSAFLLLGFALGVGVMIVLLSVGEAMLDQSRDVALVGGGAVTVLPQGIDVEAMRTGGVSGMFFGIDRARFVTRQLLGGPRHEGLVSGVAPAVEDKILYLRKAAGGGPPVAVRAGGEIPSRAAAAGAALDVREGRWHDSPADSAWLAPSAGRLYDELDRFHVAAPDSSWGEWHYFNVVVGPDEWWYLTLLVAGDGTGGGGRGQILMTRRRPDGRYDRFRSDVPASAVAYDTAAADIRLGEASVSQRDGVYRVIARAGGPAGAARIDIRVRPRANRYFPPVELRAGDFRSGYVVPGLVADASGTLCVGAHCRRVDSVPAYHDHNWGVWRDVTWEWGAARGHDLALVYGGVRAAGRVETAPFFLALVDSLGVRQVLRFSTIGYQGARGAAGSPGLSAPERFDLVALRDADTVRLSVSVLDALSSRVREAGLSRRFLQMRGRFTLRGLVGGRAVTDSGTGFFETYVGGR